MASEAVVNLVVNAAGADARIVRDIRRIADDAERRAPTIDLRVDLDTSRLDRAIRESALHARIDTRNALGDVTDVLSANLDRNFSALSDSLGEIGRQMRELSSRASVADLTMRRLDDTVRDLGRDADRADGIRRLGDDADDSDDRMTRFLGVFDNVVRGVIRGGAGFALTGTKILAMAATASTAVPVVAGLAAELVNMAPAAAVGVSAFVAFQAASATLKLGLSGVSDAISEVFALKQDPKKLEEALKNLSPNARAFVGELQGMRKGFLALRLDVQDRLFKGLDKTLTATGKATFPQLRGAAERFADSFNRMGKNVGVTAQTLGKDGTLGTALKGSTDAFANLERIPGQVLNAVVKLAAGGSPALKRITDGISGIADTLTGKLDKAAKSGALEKAIDDAVDTIQQLGRVIGNVFGGLGNIFSVADESGGGLFNTLEKITQAFQDVTGSKEFQDTLKSLIDLGNTLVSEVLPLLLQAFTVLAPVVQEVVPPLKEFVTLLGDRLSDIITELAPILEQVAHNFDLLVTALTPLVDEALKALVEALPFVNDLLTQVALLIEELTPVIAELAPIIGVALVGAIVILVETAATLVTILVNVVDAVKTVVRVAIDFGKTLFDVVVLAVKAVVDIFNGDFSGAWQKIKDIVSEVGGFIGRTVTEFGGLVLRTIGRLVDLLPSGARKAFDGLVNAAKNGVSNTISAVTTLGSRAASVIGSYASRFYNAGKSLISSFVSGIKSMISSAIGAAKSVVGAVTDFLPGSPAKKGPLSGSGYSLIRGRSLSQDFARGIMSQSPLVSKAVSSILGTSLPGSSTLPVTASVAGTGTGPGLLSASTPQLINRFTPTVNVSIGNDRLTSYIQGVVTENDRWRDRLAAQGTGR